MEIRVEEQDIPRAPGRGVRSTNPEATVAANLGVETARYQCVYPAEYLDAIDRASKAIGTTRANVMRALLRTLIEQGEVTTGLGRVTLAEVV